MSGRLYVVATPIGNLGDFSHRASEILKSVDWIACEDTRHSKGLLDHYGIHKPLISYHDFSESKKAPELVLRLQNGEKGALISDAGTPGVADPGYRIISQSVAAGVPVEAIPGAAAFLTALVVSGFPMDRFTFEGFAPLKEAAKKKWFKELAEEQRTVVFYESPHRIAATLEAIREVFGEVEVTLARELTKQFEEIVTAPVSAQLARLEKAGGGRGEFTVVVSSHVAPEED